MALVRPFDRCHCVGGMRKQVAEWEWVGALLLRAKEQFGRCPSPGAINVANYSSTPVSDIL